MASLALLKEYPLPALIAGLDVGRLTELLFQASRRLEPDRVCAGRPAGDRLADAAGVLQEGNLHTLGRGGVARGEATAVAADAGAGGEGPRVYASK